MKPKSDRQLLIEAIVGATLGIWLGWYMWHPR